MKVIKNNIAAYIRFFIKWKIFGFARSFLLFFFGHKPNVADWDGRLLIINLNALGDIVASISALSQLREYFPEKKIYFLFPKDTGITKEIFGKFADKILLVDTRKFGLDPFYSLRFINILRDVGFKDVLNMGFSVPEMPGKILAISLGAKVVVGYEGLAPQLANNWDWATKQAARFARRKIYPRYTKLVQTLDKDFKTWGLESFLRIYTALYTAFTGRPARLYPTIVSVSDETEKSACELLAERRVRLGEYAVVVPGARSPARRWPVARFGEVAKEINRLRVPIVLVGSRGEKDLAASFKTSGVETVDLIGALTVPELVSVIKHSLFVLTNDTAPVHLAIALKKPSLCIAGIAYLGMSSLYGYPSVNRWVYKKMGCLFDDWLCELGIGPNDPAPCISAVTSDEVIKELRGLIDMIQKNDLQKLARDENFKFEFESRRR